MVRPKTVALIFCLVFIFILTSSAFTFAQRPLEVDYPSTEGFEPQTTAVSVPEYVGYIFNFSLGIAGLIVFAVLVYAGFSYLTSAGNPSKQKDARDRILAAFLGLATLLGSYLLLTTINPQLIILGLPGKTIFSSPPPGSLPPAEPETLYYTEIPIGGVIEQLFLESKLENITDDSRDLMEQAEVVSDLSNELKALTDACTCDIVDTHPGSPTPCDVGNCSPWVSECVSHCGCHGEPRVSPYDPCANRAAIDAKRQELKDAVNTDKTGLKYWQEKFVPRIEDFRMVYNDLLRAEQMIKNCYGVGDRGGARFLSSYSDFFEYIDWLQEAELIKNFVPDIPFGYVSSTNPYFLATFYCAESSEPNLDIIPEEFPIDVGETSEETAPYTETACEEEIPIGETIDNAEELAIRMLAEMDSINANALQEMSNALTLSDLPEDCRGSNCASSMPTSRSCCAETCAGCCSSSPTPTASPTPLPTLPPGSCLPFPECEYFSMPCCP